MSKKTVVGILIGGVGMVVSIVGSIQSVTWLRLAGASIMLFGLILVAPAWMREVRRAKEEIRQRH